MLADKPFAKALQNFETCVLIAIYAENNLCVYSQNFAMLFAKGVLLREIFFR